MMSVFATENMNNGMTYFVYDEGNEAPHFIMESDSIGNMTIKNTHTCENVRIEVQLKYSMRNGTCNMLPLYRALYMDHEILYTGYKPVDIWAFCDPPMKTALYMIRSVYGMDAMRI